MRIVVETGGERLDRYLTERVDCTRSQLKHAKILLNGKEVKSGTILRTGDIIDAEIARDEPAAVPENISLDIVFEDDCLLIINKPRGMVVHPGAGVKRGTLLNALLGRGIYLERAGIVHRLDKNTAGLLVVAKTAEVQAKLAAMFEAHKVRRTYIGLVEGVMTGEGIIDTHIVRDSKRRTMFTTTLSGGRKAVTCYKVLKNFSKWSLVQFNLETGRTHQIRVHCKSIGHPIIGDPEYNPNSSVKGLSGQMLESVEISFLHPMTAGRVEFKINPTEEFMKTVDKLA
jgi:23S rRNA pseudouridine1911/1915/1917 synthase